MAKTYLVCLRPAEWKTAGSVRGLSVVADVSSGQVYFAREILQNKEDAFVDDGVTRSIATIENKKTLVFFFRNGTNQEVGDKIWKKLSFAEQDNLIRAANTCPQRFAPKEIFGCLALPVSKSAEESPRMSMEEGVRYFDITATKNTVLRNHGTQVFVRAANVAAALEMSQENVTGRTYNDDLNASEKKRLQESAVASRGVIREKIKAMAQEL